MNIDIRGYRGTVEDLDELLNEIKGFPCTVQLIDARAVAGSDHAIHGALHAIRAFERGQNISSDPGIEICLRIAGTRQISRALELLGLREGEMEICAVLVDCGTDAREFLDSRFQRDDSVLEPDGDYLRNLYDLGEEVKTVGVENALMERTTMLQVL
ncbi:KEOPS complex subunit Cgi121 [Methanothermobacter sp.]|uniref:KEOPS complex subunit Cgi121 n=1 Tax=Methanothermobacter sp. TaxID=1884223 RepID=UPI00261D41A6|nr:KEOPS complex subunit Cgi121 [Methanothermobacter sp.]MDI9614137.1 KEOPS complex subunit Cgi121 [Methanothermobacter sp.]